MRLDRKKIIGAFVFFWVVSAFQAHAHKVNLFCYYEDGVLSGEGYYSGGRQAKGAAIAVYTYPEGLLRAEAKTDAEGKFQIDLGAAGSLKVVMNAGQGHKAEFILEEEALSSKIPKPVGPQVSREFSEKEIRILISQEIKPLKLRVRALEQQGLKPQAATVVAGIGFIAGLFALIYGIKKKHAH